VDVVGTAARSEDELGPQARDAVEAADRRLSESIAAYELVTGPGQGLGASVPVHESDQLSRAQAAVETAEREVWRLREELLGWSRPACAPGAALLADWFSEDDAVYDDIAPGPTR